MSTKMLRWKSDEEAAMTNDALTVSGVDNSELSTIWLTVPQLRARLGLPTDDSTRRQISRWADDLDKADRRGVGRERKVRLSAMCERLQRTKFGDAVVGIEEECVTLVQPSYVAAPANRTPVETPIPKTEHSPRYESTVPSNWRAVKSTENGFEQQSNLICESSLNQYEAAAAARLILNSGIEAGWGKESESAASQIVDTMDFVSALSHQVRHESNEYIAAVALAPPIAEHVSRDTAREVNRNPVLLCQERKPLSSMSEREFAEYCRYLQVKTGRVNEAALPKMPDPEPEIMRVPRNTDSQVPNEKPISELRSFRCGSYRAIAPPKSESSIMNRVSKSVGKWFDRKLKPVVSPQPVPASPVYGAFALTARPNRLVKG